MSDTLTMALPAQQEASVAFDALYRSTAADVFSYVVSLVHDRSAAEDVTAQVFERAYRKRHRYDPGRGSERAWIFGIARNAALDELRRRGRTAALHVDPADPTAQDALGRAAGEEDEAVRRRAVVRAGLGSLEPRERELVTLKFHAGLSYAEIGELLGISESNAGTRVHRAVTKLRKACS
jgi:RNA polymerase sigma factor (sigma-70 family)